MWYRKCSRNTLRSSCGKQSHLISVLFNEDTLNATENVYTGSPRISSIFLYLLNERDTVGVYVN